jgi:hypothetical protein
MSHLGNAFCNSSTPALLVLVRCKSFGFGIFDAVEYIIGFVQVIFDRAFNLVRLAAKICWN